MKLRLLWTMTMILLLSFPSSSPTRSPKNRKRTQKIKDKLLIIVLGGFRWDYLKKFAKPGKPFKGFEEFAKKGIQTEYLESVFPAESFPAWRTIETGVYPGIHGIIGNQFYDREIHRQKVKDNINHQPQNQHRLSQAFFNIQDERSTEDLRWWHEVEPIWATGVSHNVSFATFLWARCDIAFHTHRTVKPAFCENLYAKDGTKTLHINIDMALQKFQMGIDAAIIYEDSLEKAGSEFGPLSDVTAKRLRMLDQNIQHLEDRLRVAKMSEHVNVILMSDHGMSYASDAIARHHRMNFLQDDMDINKVQLYDKLPKQAVKWIVGSGAHAGIYPRHGRREETRVQVRANNINNIMESLQAVQGIKVYLKKDIPEEFQYKMNKNTPPILVVADHGTVILSAHGTVQKPTFRGYAPGNGWDPQRLIEQTKMGVAGYPPSEEDMRGIFMAKGPGFKKSKDGELYPPIKLVDVYQVFCHLLGFEPTAGHNGTWASVRNFLRNSARGGRRTLEQTVTTFLGSWALHILHLILFTRSFF